MWLLIGIPAAIWIYCWFERMEQQAMDEAELDLTIKLEQLQLLRQLAEKNKEL